MQEKKKEKNVVVNLFIKIFEKKKTLIVLNLLSSSIHRNHRIDYKVAHYIFYHQHMVNYS